MSHLSRLALEQEATQLRLRLTELEQERHHGLSQDRKPFHEISTEAVRTKLSEVGRRLLEESQ